MQEAIERGTFTGAGQSARRDLSLTEIPDLQATPSNDACIAD